MRLLVPILLLAAAPAWGAPCKLSSLSYTDPGSIATRGVSAIRVCWEGSVSGCIDSECRLWSVEDEVAQQSIELYACLGARDGDGPTRIVVDRYAPACGNCIWGVHLCRGGGATRVCSAPQPVTAWCNDEGAPCPLWSGVTPTCKWDPPPAAWGPRPGLSVRR